MKRISRLGSGDGQLLRRWARAALLLLAAALPLGVQDPYLLDLAVTALIYMTVAVGLNVVVGYAGLLDLGHAAYFAIGAYTAALLTQRAGLSFSLALPASGVVAMALGSLIGLLVLRLRHDYLAIVTLGFGEITRTTAANLDVTGGPSGIFGLAPPSLFGLRLERAVHYYYTTLVLLVIAAGCAARLRESRIGRAWAFLREDEEAAEAMGIHTLSYRLLAYQIGTFCAGVAGAVFAMKMTAVSPASFSFMRSVLFLLAVIVGGAGSVPGALLGGALVTVLPELLRPVAGFRYLIFGAALVLLMLFRPAGLWPPRRSAEE
ncbi:branched-chain amino acid ABC transporter permease [Sorangium cellulosum]|uniref:Branched-chain amino acid ABC transporter permease n=1 Tax=Sorangium cellulosum TaxID=56 RepID=A0A150R6J0_SORCE|nr:branched-chain amino acid ABC transporter permease [Sorangium cellulosum]